jgi:hypothetical protein
MGPIDEQNHGVVLRQRRDLDLRVEVWAAHRWHPPGDLTRHAEALAARRQHRCGRIGDQQRGDELGAAVDKMLTVVQHEQRRLITELDGELLSRGSTGRLASAERGQGGATDGTRIGQGRQLHPPHAARLRVQGLDGDRQCETSLPHPRRPRQRDQPLAGEQVADLGDLAGSADQRCQLDRQVVVEQVQGPERRKRRREIRVDQLPDVFGSPEILEPMLAEVDDCGPRREVVVDQSRGRCRQQHLPAVPSGPNPGAAVERLAEVAVIAQLGFTGVHRDAHAQLRTARPGLGSEGLLSRKRSGDRVGRTAEGTHDAVTFALLDRPHPTVGDDRVIQQLIMAGNRHRHRLGRVLPSPSRCLHVAQHERHRAGR